MLRPFIVIAFGLCAAPLFAQTEADEEESPWRPGLVATYTSADKVATCQRIDETIAFDWQAAAPDPRITAGKFTALWRGNLWTQGAGAYRLHAFVQGNLKLHLDGKQVLAIQAAEPQWVSSEPLELTFAYRPLEIWYEKSGDEGKIALFWSGPGFSLEPIPDRFLFHERAATIATEFARGRQLAAALRCDACHAADSARPPMPAPALDRLAGNIEPAWLVKWLSREGEAPAEPPRDTGSPGGSPSQLVRRMPHFGLSLDEATDIAAWLLRPSAEKPMPAELDKPKDQKSSEKKKEKKSAPSADEGERLFITLGCLACHQHGELGESGLFGGGDLTNIAAKRPPEFFARWLADPASLNRQHRMPVFDLSADERTSLALWLGKQGSPLTGRKTEGDFKAGEKLVAKHRCIACHDPSADRGPLAPRAEFAASAGSAVIPLSNSSDWPHSCAAAPDPKKSRPGYRLAESDQVALKVFYSTPRPSQQKPSLQTAGRDLLVELNCLSCHQREGIDRQTSALPARLQDKLAAVVTLHDSLGKQVPAMTPPALNSVGDKLTDTALAASIRRQGQPHRSYLMVRMPKFDLTDEQVATLTAYFTATDRIPLRGAGVSPAVNNSAGGTPAPQMAALAAAGPRLVTTDGFACTSCHQVGSVLPDKAPLNARGPSLSLIEKRIRREWFDRWCANPARIVPRMEMPSVQVPVRGVLGENVRDQLAAVWHTLNTPGFEPPEPNPVRVLRLSGVPERKEAPIVLHDVIKDGDKSYLFPLVIGLPNRHNILFDLETNRLAAWWLGDTARQRTKGKSWYWEMGGKSIFEEEGNPPIVLTFAGRQWVPQSSGQFAAEINSYYATAQRASIGYRLTFGLAQPSADDAAKKMIVGGRQIFSIHTKGGDEIQAGFRREIYVLGVGAHESTQFRLVPKAVAEQCIWDDQTKELHLPGQSGISIQVSSNEPIEWNRDGTILIRETEPIGVSDGWVTSVELTYTTTLPTDQYLVESPKAISLDATSVEVAPGFSARRLPLPGDIMPTALDWKADGRLLFTSLKGQVFAASDSDGDGVDDTLACLVDGLAAPYGLCSNSSHDLVVDKSGMFQLTEIEGLNRKYVSNQVVASGWGVTNDYHDWAIGLVRGAKGEYYIGLPCQQDDRSEAAAKYRGQVLKLVPRKATPDNPRLFDIETVSSGHRFPMGLAMSRTGDLFVTDNQGNYNPFNELNHVRQGAFFGFVNAIDKEKGIKPPPLVPPAIDIPHPWTRSVNGICFLETPQTVLAKVPLAERADHKIFGPLKGHLVGCEYDTRALIRMTLQKVGDTYQGAAYPLSIPPRNIEDGLLGPIVCAVSPKGELYVGNIRDSGWGAGNNVGDIVKIKIEPEKLPCGIQEVRATKDGFTLDFFRPVDPKKGADPVNYALASYRRESTPAYGGPNLDRRIEKIAQVELSPDAQRVTLRLDQLRPGFVYEFQLQPLTRGKELFHPAEAHYTLRQIPK